MPVKRQTRVNRIPDTCTSLYSVLIVAFFAVMSPVLIYQAVRYRKYIGSLPQRLGYLPISFNLDADESIWIHAVSVGEVLTARALLPALRERYPKLRLFLSTTTMTGQQIARNNLQYVDEVFYFPFDLGFIVDRTLALVRPRLFIMMETEIWPNQLRACDRAGVKTILVNGRISSRSYPRYRLVAAVLPARPRPRRSFLHAERRVGASRHRHRRRSRARDRHRVAEIRLARIPGNLARGSRQQSRAALLPDLAGSARS